ncbi:MAG: phage holin family protein [Propionibacteriales bacterium]|nr:phage holin family protein [Propionibacteriales bacterium]
MTTTNQGRPLHDDDPTIGRLVADTTKDVSSLIRSEIELAKTELKFSVKLGGIGAALLAVAAFIGLLAIIMISIAFAFFLDWWFAGTATAFAIVFVIYLLIAGVLALMGIKKIKQVKAPQQTIAAVKSNKQVLKRG